MAIFTLDKLAPGESGKVIKVSGKGPIRRRLVDMGLSGGAEIEMVKVSPLGDPIEYRLRGYHLSLRRSEAESIEIELIEDAVSGYEFSSVQQSRQLLSKCKSGQKVVVSQIRGGRRLRGKLTNQGIILGTDIKVVNNDFPGPLIVSTTDENRVVLKRGEAFHILVKPS